MRGFRYTVAAAAIVAAWINCSSAEETPRSSPPVLPPPIRIAPPPFRIAAPAPPPRNPGKSRAASPLSSPGGWITEDDYPALAVRNELQGTTGVTVTVGIDGRASNCKVQQTSDSAVLDATACALVEERASFAPALDYDGEPVESLWSTRVVWRIPEDTNEDLAGPLLANRKLSFSFIAEADGSVTDCKVMEVSGPGVPPEGLCPAGEHVLPVLDENGLPMRKQVTVTFMTEVTDPPR
jgi:TonB family protein